MRQTPNVKAERYRLRIPGHFSSEVSGNCGAFEVPAGCGVWLRVIASDCGGWDHVSVSLPDRCPDWDEMSRVKELFFRDDEWAMQLHPAKASHISCHPFALHIWRPQAEAERQAIAASHGGELMPHWPTPGPIPIPPKEAVA